MADNTTPKIGTILEPSDTARDAVHVALIPVTSDYRLHPGDRVGLAHGRIDLVTRDATRKVGIVDPFLPEPVKPGERFYLFLFPGTITGLRHVWTHPDFMAKTPVSRQPDLPHDPRPTTMPQWTGS